MGQESAEHRLVARPVDLEQDYNTIANMWQSHGANPPPMSVFAPNGNAKPPLGILITYKDVAICNVFMYHTGASMCMLEFMVCHADAPKALRDPALKIMLETGVAWAKENEYEFIYTATSSRKFMNRLEDSGFVAKGAPQQHYFWGLDNG